MIDKLDFGAVSEHQTRGKLLFLNGRRMPTIGKIYGRSAQPSDWGGSKLRRLNFDQRGIITINLHFYTL